MLLSRHIGTEEGDTYSTIRYRLIPLSPCNSIGLHQVKSRFKGNMVCLHTERYSASRSWL